MDEYIDKESFKKSVEERYCKPCKAEGKDHNGCWCRACWVDDMLDEVDCFKPADVVPVVHGRWDNLDGYKTRRACSMCGWDVPEYGKFYSYCPNCGAKMDGGNNDAAD